MSFFEYEGNKLYYEEKGSGDPLILLHGNTASSKIFSPIIPLFTTKYQVITIDFLGCGKSDRINMWPSDLWHEWSKQVKALCTNLNISKVKIIGCSGGALVAINFALENPNLVDCIIADSFEGLKANSYITEQICKERKFLKQNPNFCNWQKKMHGLDWENVFDADTKAIINHNQSIGSFIHKQIDELKVNMMLTGSIDDEMFPKNHYKNLFADICDKTNMAKSHIFLKGKHPAMLSNMNEFVKLCNTYFKQLKDSEKNFVIQNETPQDYHETENLVREAFWNVYRPGCSEHYVLHTLRNHPDFIKELDFILKLNDQIIGQIVFVKHHISTTPVLTMGPICIHPKYQRRGYGKKLLDFALNIAKEKGYFAVLIEGDINFYAKSGFNYASNYGIKYDGLSEDDDSSFFLCKELKAGSLKPGKYSTHPAYLVEDKNVEEFDKNFPKKEKRKLPSQIF